MTSAQSAWRGQGGFTIPSILVGIALSLLAAGAFASFHHLQLVTFKTEANRVDLQTAARNILDVFTGEIRQAGANPKCVAGIQPIADAKQQLLRIQADLNGDGAISGAGEDVTYEYKFSLKKFERTSGGVTDALVTDLDLSGSRIRYFDGAGVELTAGSTGLPAGQRSQVRRIRLELILQQSADVGGNTGPLRVAVANDVHLRNRYFADAVACP